MGFALDMSSQYNRNRYWPEVRRNRREALRRIYLDSVRHHVILSGEDKIDPEVLREIKERIRKQIKKERRRSAFIYLISALICLIAIITLVFLLNGMFLRA